MAHSRIRWSKDALTELLETRGGIVNVEPSSYSFSAALRASFAQAIMDRTRCGAGRLRRYEATESPLGRRPSPTVNFKLCSRSFRQLVRECSSNAFRRRCSIRPTRHVRTSFGSPKTCSVPIETLLVSTVAQGRRATYRYRLSKDPCRAAVVRAKREGPLAPTAPF